MSGNEVQILLAVDVLEILPECKQAIVQCEIYTRLRVAAWE